MTEERLPRGEAIDNGAVLRSLDLAKLADTTPRALRHYHKIGLLPEVPRDPNGYRRYSLSDLVRVLRIRQLTASGMPLRKIGSLLEQDLQNQDDLLAKLDRDLKEQAERIKVQRKMIAELRRLSMQTGRFSGLDNVTTTQQLDQDVWTLITATGSIDTDTAAAMLGSLQSAPLVEQIAAWYPEFESLESQTHIDDERADLLAERMASFADAASKTAGFAPSREEQSIMALVEQMQADTLTPAQQKVWALFLSKIKKQWDPVAD